MAGGITPQELAIEKPHLGDDEGPAVVAGSIVLIVTATLAVVFRILSRRHKKLNLGADDYLIILALLFAYGMFVSILYCVQYGLGEHIVRVGKSDAIMAGRAVYVLEAIYPFCTGSTKLSILLLYRRIFTTNDRYFKWALCAVGSILLGWALSAFFTTVFQCWPVQTTWIEPFKQDACIDLVPALIGLAVINTLLNGAVLILPLPKLWNLRISRQQKFALFGIFFLGSADVISSIIRTYMTSQLKTTDVDLTYLETAAATLAFVEPSVGIICACLPVMRALLITLFSPIISIFSSLPPSHAVRKASERSTPSGRTVVAYESQEDVYPLKGMTGHHEYYPPERREVGEQDEEQGGSEIRRIGGVNPYVT